MVELNHKSRLDLAPNGCDWASNNVSDAVAARIFVVLEVVMISDAADAAAAVQEDQESQSQGRRS